MVNKKKASKSMFLMKETLVNLTPYLLSQAQGGSCIGISNFNLTQGCPTAGICIPQTTTEPAPDPNDKYRIPRAN
jgi:hypothetical protein